ncbi:T9SS type A sorting domain-containing protein [Flammeovirga pectinis]|uniref:T9SS type A sorting domain-containing protein n=1 Tax=Flammeovirga pectinis TaxID=2494373 RepID=A0A3S9PA66_9BACT|nr:T9SS type A sorting domain-containing protein [Flammeovirga pectinis]AZQ65111.1 T9SS type A sorting domain-containing protein [Flammeovirga pectinis]
MKARFNVFILMVLCSFYAENVNAQIILKTPVSINRSSKLYANKEIIIKGGFDPTVKFNGSDSDTLQAKKITLEGNLYIKGALITNAEIIITGSLNNQKQQFASSISGDSISTLKNIKFEKVNTISAYNVTNPLIVEDKIIINSSSVLKENVHANDVNIQHGLLQLEGKKSVIGNLYIAKHSTYSIVDTASVSITESFSVEGNDFEILNDGVLNFIENSILDLSRITLPNNVLYFIGKGTINFTENTSVDFGKLDDENLSYTLNWNIPNCDFIPEKSLVTCDYLLNTASPIALISFTGKIEKGKNTLHWSTSSEINCDYYIIERSVDKKDWEALDQIKVYDDRLIKSTYFWQDHLSEAFYYRILQVDIDGNSEEFGPIQVGGNEAIFNVKVIPNAPKDKTAILELNALDGNITTYEIYSTNGYLMRRKTLDTSKVKNKKIPLDFTDLDKGQYIIRVNNGQFIAIEKIVIP